MNTFITFLLRRLNFLKTKEVKQVVIYVLTVLFMFLILVMLDRLFAGFSTFWHLVLFMISALVLGIGNVIILDSKLYDNLPNWLKTFIVLTANLLGAIILTSFSSNLTLPAYGLLFLPAIFLFSFPWFFITTLRAILSIPELSYLPIYVTNLKDIVAEINWAEDKSRGIVWEFENILETEEKNKYWIRTHTPKKVEELAINHLFKCLLSLHNHNLHPEQPIDFVNENQPYGWRFYYEKTFLIWTIRRPINPLKSLVENGIRFQFLSEKERSTIENLREEIDEKFKKTKLIITRTSDHLEN